MTARFVAGRIGFYTLIAVLLAFFTIPLLWLATAPFTSDPTYEVAVPDFTWENFQAVVEHPYALPSLYNSLVLSVGTAVLVVAMAALAAYALSRVRMPGRDALLYALLLLSSIITGTAAMVPLFQLAVELNLIDSQLGLILILTGGLLPAAIFMLKDFMDSTPKSYEESARVFGASPLQIVRHVVVPLVRPGLATIAVWAVANVWGNFLMPYLLLSDVEKQPAAVITYTLYTEGGQANLRMLSTFGLLYSVPVVLMYLFVSKKYGFRFHGGIKR
ncbi:carbohydrate ABC transporter permease [Nonomuraea polychroma]|jgi:multiple sugar transport system permease protein|uniref:Carbohydrate ABC transporter membrane protein 2 (CUT1 family) n=1 Tax=Nonomuraea polychroma TaxID=46176 RepID=A0A438LWP1_9ACTN|nr:carbohydrate ABC transporter permease [Nonomuraea polychroma]RVX37767.1 carbohydrate ABC transporter membrane protein 2 (CUT1 family) [Nonomuraea polychroma]